MTNISLKAIAAGVAFGFVVWRLVNMRVEVPVSAAGSCESLTSLKLPSATITSAKVEPATAPDVKSSPALAVSLPESCRVAATLRPSSDSEIKMELWMPVRTGTANSRLSATARSTATSITAR